MRAGCVLLAIFSLTRAWRLQHGSMVHVAEALAFVYDLALERCWVLLTGPFYCVEEEARVEWSSGKQSRILKQNVPSASQALLFAAHHLCINHGCSYLSVACRPHHCSSFGRLVSTTGIGLVMQESPDLYSSGDCSVKGVAMYDGLFL